MTKGNLKESVKEYGVKTMYKKSKIMRTDGNNKLTVMVKEEKIPCANVIFI